MLRSRVATILAKSGEWRAGGARCRESEVLLNGVGGAHKCGELGQADGAIAICVSLLHNARCLVVGGRVAMPSNSAPTIAVSAGAGSLVPSLSMGMTTRCPLRRRMTRMSRSSACRPWPCATLPRSSGSHPRAPLASCAVYGARNIHQLRNLGSTGRGGGACK